MQEELISTQYLKSALMIKRKELEFVFSWFLGLFRINEFNAIYNAVKHKKGLDFIDGAMQNQNIKLEILKKEEGVSFPEKKGFIVVANHPTGILDGVLILKALIPIRKDVKIVVNQELKRLTPLNAFLLPVSRNKKVKTHQSKFTEARAILKHLEADKPIIFFPAARVSNFLNLRKFRLEDRKWEQTCLKILSRSNVPVYPVHITGRTSFTYQFLFLLYQKLAVLWLIPEFVNSKNKHIKLTINRPVSVFSFPTEKVERVLKRIIYSA